VSSKNISGDRLIGIARAHLDHITRPFTLPPDRAKPDESLCRRSPTNATPTDHYQSDPNRNVRNSRALTDGLDGLASCLADATQRKSLVPVPAPTAHQTGCTGLIECARVSMKPRHAFLRCAAVPRRRINSVRAHQAGSQDRAMSMRRANSRAVNLRPGPRRYPRRPVGAGGTTRSARRRSVPPAVASQ
jgi:hypothetical protein